MNLRDAETGKILWQGTEDLSVPGVEHEGNCVASLCTWGHVWVTKAAGVLVFGGQMSWLWLQALSSFQHDDPGPCGDGSVSGRGDTEQCSAGSSAGQGVSSWPLLAQVLVAK